MGGEGGGVQDRVSPAQVVDVHHSQREVIVDQDLALVHVAVHHPPWCPKEASSSIVDASSSISVSRCGVTAARRRRVRRAVRPGSSWASHMGRSCQDAISADSPTTRLGWGSDPPSTSSSRMPLPGAEGNTSVSE